MQYNVVGAYVFQFIEHNVFSKINIDKNQFEGDSIMEPGRVHVVLAMTFKFMSTLLICY